MQICMLVELRHLPIPEGIEQQESFGSETVVVEGSKVEGTVYVLNGSLHEFMKWLSKFDYFLTSTAPSLGIWNSRSIPTDLTASGDTPAYRVIDLITNEELATNLTEDGAELISQSYNAYHNDALSSSIERIS